MKFETLRLLTACLALTATACGSEGSSTDDLGDALDRLASAAEEEALREHGVDAEDAEAADADEAAGEALGDEGEEAPARGERIQAFCAERAADVLARCEELAAEGALPEDAPTCEAIAEHAERHCVRRAVRHVRNRIREHAEACREEARGAARACAEDGGDRGECRAAAIEAGRACIEALPDRPRPEGERPEGERPALPEACVDAARAAGQACIEGGGTPEECRAGAVEAARACAAEAGIELPPPEGDRPERPEGEGDRPEGEGDRPVLSEECLNAARAAGQACIEGGGTPEACRMEAHEAARACVEAEGGELPPPPEGERVPPEGDREGERQPPEGDRDGERRPPISEECLNAARAAGQACIEGGGTPEACRTEAMEAAQACAEG